MLRLSILLAAFLSLPLLSNAQTSCQWKLQLTDSGGDGWGGSAVGYFNVTTGDFFFLQLDGFADNGADTTYIFEPTEGDVIQLFWYTGSANPEEIGVAFYDGSNNLLLNVTNPVGGTLLQQTVTCPPCALPVNIFEENIYDKRVKLRWTPGTADLNATGWWVIYGPAGFVPMPGTGDTAYVTTPKLTITGLEPNTPYTYYVIQDCGAGAVSGTAGPFNFETYWSNDVSVTAVLTPESACDLTSETITFAMSNPGSNPQSLIPYNYWVNGVPGGVPQPEDGYYTGVIGKDSTEIIEFETPFNFSDPIEYEITVYTQMIGDQDTNNDTLRYYINNILAPPYAQTYEKWNGGWTVVNDPNSFPDPSWEHGKPNAPLIQQAGEGQKAWVTNLKGNANWGETSYIESTCFDFSDVTKSPAVQFLINYQCDSGSDGAYVEYTLNDGATWSRIGTVANTGANWYNAPDPTTGTNSRAFAGASNGWIKAQHLAPALIGKPDVRFRFGYTEGFTQQSEGVGIDQFRVFVPEAIDGAAIKGRTQGENSTCGQELDKFILNVVNVGVDLIPNGYTLFYQIGNGPIDSISITNNSLVPDENLNHTFASTFDSRDKLTIIKAWIRVAGDADITNDTTTYSIDHRAEPLPLFEDFEASFDYPDGWTVNNNAFVNDGHNNVSNVITTNLYSGIMSFSYELPRHGVVGVTDSIRFDYRIVDFSFPYMATNLGVGNKMDVQVSSDCGATYQTIFTVNSANHISTEDLTTIQLSLGSFVGSSIIVRFRGTWISGDYYFDLDNINLVACGADMGLSAKISPPSPNNSNGTAFVNVGNGNPPYTFIWSTGEDTQEIEGLAPGFYTVTVNDSHGCSDTLVVDVQVSNITDVPGFSRFNVRPNPTTGMLFLDVQFEQSVELQAELLNLLGQRVWASEGGETTGINEAIDLSTAPNGIYMLRVIANGQVTTKKIVKNSSN
jgi:hypothetical protein